MTRATRTGTPPPTLPPTDLVPTDEGPMRRELLRQIGLLEDELTLENTQRGRLTVRATACRGPAWQDARALEQIRDELAHAVGELQREDG